MQELLRFSNKTKEKEKRIWISLKEYSEVELRNLTQTLIISVVLLFCGLFVFAVFTTTSNAKRKYESRQCQQRIEEIQKNTCTAFCEQEKGKVIGCNVVDNYLKIACVIPEDKYIKMLEIKQ